MDGLSSRLALDVQGVDALRMQVREPGGEGLREATRQFEALLLQMMIKSMREATPGEHLLGGQAESFYTSMLDQQVAQSLSARGIGLADALRAQLSRGDGL